MKFSILIGLMAAVSLLAGAWLLAFLQHRSRQRQAFASGQPITRLLRSFRVSRWVVVLVSFLAGSLSALAAAFLYGWMEKKEMAEGTLSTAVLTGFGTAFLLGLLIGLFALPLVPTPEFDSKD